MVETDFMHKVVFSLILFASSRSLQIRKIYIVITKNRTPKFLNFDKNISY